MLRVSFFFFFFLLLAACAGPKLPEVSFPDLVDTHTRQIDRPAFKQDSFPAIGLRLAADFPGGRVESATYSDGILQVAVAPENIPINSCAYYSFMIDCDTLVDLTIDIRYSEGKHCYHPWYSRDAYYWKQVDSNAVQRLNEGVTTRIYLKAQEGKHWISAIPLATSETVSSWVSTMALHPAVNLRNYGNSKEGKPLNALDISEGNPKGKPILALLARQHPAEVNGYYGLQKIVEEMLDNNPIADAFRKKYRVLVFPLVNPDGVDMGNWRHSAAGVDLHWDWAKYRQPEVKQLAEFLYQNVKEHKTSLKLAIDFHAADRDKVFRLNTLGPSRLPIFTDQWLEALTAQSDFLPELLYYDLGRPVTAAWAWQLFRAEGLLVELDRNCSRSSSYQLGKIAGRALMELLLQELGIQISAEEIKSSADY